MLLSADPAAVAQEVDEPNVKVVRIPLDTTGRIAADFEWQAGAGLRVCAIFSQENAADDSDSWWHRPSALTIGDLLVSVGGRPLRDLASEEEAKSLLSAATDEAMEEGGSRATVEAMVKCGGQDQPLSARSHGASTRPMPLPIGAYPADDEQDGLNADLRDLPPLPALPIGPGEGPYGAAVEDVQALAEVAPPPPVPLGWDGPARITKKVRLYRGWPAENRFFCCGFAMTGSPGHTCSVSSTWRDCRTCLFGWGSRSTSCCESLCLRVENIDAIDRPCCTATSPANCFAWICILLPSSLYFGVALPYFWTRVHPLIPLISLFFLFLTAGCLLAACCSDPGIIPRREVIIASGTAAKLQQELGYNLLGETCATSSDAKGSSSSAVEETAGPVTVRVRVPQELRSQGYRWCHTCKIVRPPRASHCADCDNCVLRFDHHCPFVNNCVGQRNYLFFMGFTSSVCCLAIWVIPLLIWYLVVEVGFSSTDRRVKTESVGFDDVDKGPVLTGVLVTLAVAGGLAGICVFLLWGYHLFLICSGLTTKEHWKGRRDAAPAGGGNSTFLPGLGEELTVFGRRGPRLFDPRSMVEVVLRDDQPPSGAHGHGHGRASHSVGRQRPPGRWRLKGAGDHVVEV